MELEEKEPARVFIVDPHPLLREGLAAEIACQRDMEICGEAGNATEARAKIASTAPDLVVFEVSRKHELDWQFIDDIQRRKTAPRVLVLSGLEEDVHAQRALAAGASGFVSKERTGDTIVDAIRLVLQGNVYFRSESIGAPLGESVDRFDGLRAVQTTLTERELQVFQLIGRGFPSKKIARRMNISVNTVDSYRAKIKKKLNLKTGADLTHRAIRWVMMKE
jgi:DNA-binding NarL/FixJ family response regulator